MATLDEIAQELGLSKGTVSKALNGASDISQKTRQSVLEKAVELGYSRRNRSRNAPRVAVFVINMEYSKPEDFGYDIVIGFRKAAELSGYHVEIVPITQSLQRSIRYDEYMMRENYCGGFFLGMSLLDPWIQEFRTCNTPTVLYDNHISGNPKVSDVSVDSNEGIELAVRHLRSLGHSRIGYLSSALEAYVYQQRYQSFIRVMTSLGLCADETVMGNSFHVNECLSEHLHRLLKNGCTAILCSHDLLAHSVMVHCMELGLQIPADISILGYDDIPLCAYTIPPLTSIRQNRPALGRTAFQSLASCLGGTSLSSLMLHPELVQRSSCGPAPKTPKLPARLTAETESTSTGH